MKINIYIDGNNLYRSAKELGFEIDYRKLGVWLRQKYNANIIYLFIGFIPVKENFYRYLGNCGFTLIFKKAISIGNFIKGNCDAELVLKVVLDFYLKEFDSCILITGDGDFGCLVEFLGEQKSIVFVIAPDKKKCSILLRNKDVEVAFLNEHYHKFSTLA
jgi:uncharacterized LabA/DUF88 family protein